MCYGWIARLTDMKQLTHRRFVRERVYNEKSHIRMNIIEGLTIKMTIKMAVTRNC